MKLIGGSNLRKALNVMTPKADAVNLARTAELPLGARTRLDVFAAAPKVQVPLAELASGVASLAALTPSDSAYAFPTNFLRSYQELLSKAGIPAANGAEANNFLNSVLLRDDKPHTAAFVRTAMENPKALDEVLTNIAKYTNNPNNSILPAQVTDVSGAFDRAAFLPFLGSETLANGLVGAMKKDLERGGKQLVAAAEAGVGPDISVIGQGPSGAVLARGLATKFAEFNETEGAELSAAVIGGETTFSAGNQWNLNSPNRAVRGDEILGPGGPLNPIDDRLTDGDLSGGYYATAQAVDAMTKVSLHNSGLPVLTAQLASVGRQEGGGYLLRTGAGVTVPTNMVAFAAGLGDLPKALATDGATAFVREQDALMKSAIDQAKAGNSEPLRNFPLWVSVLDFNRAREELNDPLSMFATKATAGDIKAASRSENPLLRNNRLEFRRVSETEGEYRQIGSTVFRLYPLDKLANDEYSTRALAQPVPAASGPEKEYLARALYKSKLPLAEISDSTLAQKVVGVVGFGDSARTALEGVTGFGPDSRSPRQLNVVPKLLWFVGEQGPRDCAEFYTGDLFKGFEAFDQKLKSFGGTDLSALFANKLREVPPDSNLDAIRGYLDQFSQLLTTAKPAEYFNKLLEGSGLTEAQTREAFGVFLKERDAVRPRYNQLVIPIEKGQIELIRQRVNDVQVIPASGAAPARQVLISATGERTIVDHVLDARGAETNVASVLGEITGNDKDPFNNPEKFEFIEVVGRDGERQIIGKRLKGEDIYSFGPASGVVSNNTTNVGANKVSIFLNRPLNEIGGEALAQEVLLRFKTDQLGTPEQRAVKATSLESRLEALRAAETIQANAAQRAQENVALAPVDRYLRSALERDPLSYLTSLNQLLERTQFSGGGRMSIKISRLADGFVTIDAPAGLSESLRNWATTRPASDFLRSALGGGKLVSIERGFDARGALVPLETWI